MGGPLAAVHDPDSGSSARGTTPLGSASSSPVTGGSLAARNPLESGDGMP